MPKQLPATRSMTWKVPMASWRIGKKEYMTGSWEGVAGKGKPKVVGRCTDFMMAGKAGEEKPEAKDAEMTTEEKATVEGREHGVELPPGLETSTPGEEANPSGGAEIATVAITWAKHRM